MKFKISITRRILIYLIFIIVLSNILVYLGSYFMMRKSFRKEFGGMANALMDLYMDEIEQYFKDIDALADSMIYSRNVIYFLKEEQDTAEHLEFVEGMGSLYYLSRPDLKLTFYKEGKYQDKYSVELEERTFSIEDYRKARWYLKMEEGKKDRMVLVNYQSEERTKPPASIFYRIRDFYFNDTVGWLRIDLDRELFRERFLNGGREFSGITVSEASGGDVLFYEGTQISLPKEAVGEQKGFYETADEFTAWEVSEHTGFQIAVSMSKEEMKKSQRDLLTVQLFLLAALVGGTVLASGRCFSVLTENFRRLTEGMKRVKEGSLDTQVEAAAMDEVGFLIREFNDVVQKVDHLLTEVESKQILLKEAEIKALQQQINPHFTYNILETIMGLASEGMDEEVITVSKCMSSMLRYNTRFENTTKLREEIRQVKNYIQVMKIRFENRFEEFYDIDEECLDFEIVKFTLQPLVENAISHGLCETSAGGMIRIRIKRETSSYTMMVYDNGTGITQEKLAELNMRLKKTTERPLEYIEQYKSLGLLNVHLRLKVYYGEGYEMEVFSKEGKGTCIFVRVPVEG